MPEVSTAVMAAESAMMTVAVMPMAAVGLAVIDAIGAAFVRAVRSHAPGQYQHAGQSQQQDRSSKEWIETSHGALLVEVNLDIETGEGRGLFHAGARRRWRTLKPRAELDEKINPKGDGPVVRIKRPVVYWES